MNEINWKYLKTYESLPLDRNLFIAHDIFHRPQYDRICLPLMMDDFDWLAVGNFASAKA